MPKHYAPYLGNPHDSPVWEEVADELTTAVIKFPQFNSPHEGWAVIYEELDELWQEVMSNKAGTARVDDHHKLTMRNEAKQVAVMAIRFMIDLT